MQRKSSGATRPIVAMLVAIFATVILPPPGAHGQQSATCTQLAKQPVVYVNKQYGFRFNLPKTWKGFAVSERSESSAPLNVSEEKHARPETWGVIVIRHPLWTAEAPREDIPIVVFTHAQWKRVERETLIVSAAPMPPTELAHNAHYVFALPARYNYDMSTGYEEVQNILSCGALHPF